MWPRSGRAIGRRDGAPYRPAAVPAACLAAPPAAPAAPAAPVPDPRAAEAGKPRVAEVGEPWAAGGTPGTDSPGGQIVAALTVIDGALGELWGVFFSPVTAGQQPSGGADARAAAPVS